MRVLDWVEADLAKERAGARWIIPLALALAMAALGLGMRRDFIDAFTPGNLVPALAILAAIGVFPWLLRRRALAWAAIALALGLSLIQPRTEVSLAKFQPDGSFWPETAHCFGLGLLSGGVAALLLTYLGFRLLPTPGRPAQLLCAAVAGASGLAALAFHCMGPLASHTILGHWGQGLPVFLFAFGVQRAYLARKTRQALGRSGALKNLGSIAD